MMQTVQGRQTQGYGGNSVRSNATGSSLNRNRGTSTAAWFKEKAMLAEALESRVALDDKQMAFLANNRAIHPQLVMYTDSQLREVIVDRNAKVTDFENQIHSLKLQLSATVESHKTLSTTVDVLKQESKAKEDKYLKEIIDLEKKKKALDNVVYKMGQSMQTMHMLTKPQVFYDEAHKTALGYQNPLYLTQDQRKVSSLYYGNTIVKPHDVLSAMDTEETLELAEESRLKMHAKQNDPIAKEKKVNILPISKSVSKTPPVQPKPVLKEIPRELPTISLVEDSFNKTRSHVNDFDNVVNVCTKVPGQNEGSWGFEHIRKAFEKDVKPFVNTLKVYFHMFDQELRAELSIRNDMVEKAIYSELSKNVQAQLEEKNNSISKLKDHIDTLKDKGVSESDKSQNTYKSIAPGMYRLDLEPLSPKLLQNKEAYVDYLKHTLNIADILREIVDQDRTLNPLDSNLDSACRYIT
ncbi:hypothetical protein Tco_0096785 [Tanacetum coccineum]